MGFLFRLCFWVGVAVLIMPPEDRPGMAMGGGSDLSLQDRMQLTLTAAWEFANQVSMTCETNPQLCAATQALAQTTAATGQALLQEVQGAAQTLAKAHATAQTPINRAAPEYDGRVGLYQDPAG